MNTYYETQLDLKSDKGVTKGFFDYKKGKLYITLIDSNKNSVRREIGLGSMLDVAKFICDAQDFKCRKCNKKLSLEKGEIHHGCLSCI